MPASSPYLRHLPAVEGEQASEDTEDFWAVWQAASGGLPSRATRPFLHGMTGGAFRSSHAPLLQSDLSCWLVPGLALCGVQAALMPLPADASELLSFLRDAFRHTAQLPLFAFAISPEEANDADSNLLPVSVSTQQRRNRDSRTKPEILENDGLTLPPDDMEISRQTLLTALAADKNCLTLITRTGTPQTVRLEELVGFASHTLLLKRAPLRVSRAVCARWAIHQWAVFALACPERLLTTNAADAPIRELASQFWNELGGKGRSTETTRLRHLAQRFENAACPDDVAAISHTLYLLACESFDLPQEVQNALLAPPNSILTDAERRELIYLCRAGTRDLKILAAHRLAYEREHADAHNTLLQLRFESDAWVRKMAHPNFPSH